MARRLLEEDAQALMNIRTNLITDHQRIIDADHSTKSVAQCKQSDVSAALTNAWLPVASTHKIGRRISIVAAVSVSNWLVILASNSISMTKFGKTDVGNTGISLRIGKTSRRSKYATSVPLAWPTCPTSALPEEYMWSSLLSVALTS